MRTKRKAAVRGNDGMRGRFQNQNGIQKLCRIRRSELLAVLLVMALSGVAGCGKAEKTEPALEQEHIESEAQGEAEEGLDSESGYQAILWQGEEYEYNSHLSNFLFLGIDTETIEETATGRADAGQADALYLVSYDRVTKELALISIPRDTMTQIEVFDQEGQSLGLTEQHISLSYGYGDGKYGSLELAEQAVSKLFYGLPIQSSCAMTLDGITELMQQFGEVKLIVPNDSLAEQYPELQEGAEAVITAETAETFLRWRDTNQTQSAIDRMERQQAFLKAFGKASAEKYADNPEGALELYKSLSPYLVTTIGDEWLLKLAEGYFGGASVEEWTVPGEGVEGNPFDEYRVDDEAFYEKLVETFYEKG